VTNVTTLAPSKEVVLTTYEDVRAALGSEDLARSLDYEKYEKGNIKEGVISLLHGSEHRERRRVENTLFRRETLELYERVLFPDIVEHTLAEYVDPNRSDLMEIGWLMTCVLAARTAGVDFDRESLGQRQRLRHFLRLFAVGGAIDVATGDVEEVKARMRTAIAEFDQEFVAQSRARRRALVLQYERGEIAEDALPRDMLTTLIRNRDELRMDEGLLLRETTTFFTAGAHTSTQTMTNTLHQLFEWTNDHPEDWERLAADVYFVQRAVQEALRTRPTNPLIHRRALRDTVIRGREIAEGTRVLLDTISANSDASVYGEDAAGFNPHRVYPPGMPPYGTSFGGGIHLCMGRTLAVGLPVREPAWTPDENHLYGLVSQAVQALVRRGVRPDPERPPVRDEQTTRWTRWADYPVVFDASRAAAAPA
jgi:cytochrome P450